MEQYEYIRELGHGSNGSVKLYRDLIKNEFVAIKHIPLSKDSLNYRRELHSLEQLRSFPNIVRILKSFSTKEDFCLVLEYCEGGTLEENLEYCLKRAKDYRYQIICDLIRAVSSVHKAGLVHRDIKAENILFKSGTLKLSDFGLSKIVNFEEPSTSCGTPINMAPEMFTQKKHNQKVDIWSLGCVIYRILKGKHPFQASSRRELMELQKNQVDLTELKEKEVQFFEMIFKYNHNMRASIDDLIHSRLIQSYIRKISKNLENVYNFYLPFNNQDARIIRSAISLNFCTDPLFQSEISIYVKELKSFAKHYNKSSFDLKLVDIILKTIEYESKKLNQTHLLHSNYLLYLNRRISILPNPTDYDILLELQS
jgi:serine/threonine protein kinase